MQRDSKLGCGFLLVGAGLAYLIDKALVPTAAIVVSVACVITGGAFLLAGARHKEGEIRPRKKIWEVLAIVFVLGTLVVLVSTPILRYMPKRESAKPETAKVTQEDLQQIKDAVKQSIENSTPPTKQAKKNRTAVKPAPPFYFAIDVAMFSPSRDKTVMLYLASPGITGTTICPANLALYLRLQNLQTVPVRLSGWSLELAYGDKWIEPVKLDSRFGTMYFVTNDPKKAGIVDSQVGFDAQLAAKSYILKPNDPVEGWALFEYSKDFPVFAGDYRLSVKDTLGHEWSGIVSWPDPKQRNTNLLGGLIKFTGVGDVSPFSVKFCDEQAK